MSLLTRPLLSLCLLPYAVASPHLLGPGGRVSLSGRLGVRLATLAGQASGVGAVAAGSSWDRQHPQVGCILTCPVGTECRRMLSPCWKAAWWPLLLGEAGWLQVHGSGVRICISPCTGHVWCGEFPCMNTVGKTENIMCDSI